MERREIGARGGQRYPATTGAAHPDAAEVDSNRL